jgi:hypothetical protein
MSKRFLAKGEKGVRVIIYEDDPFQLVTLEPLNLGYAYPDPQIEPPPVHKQYG